MKPLMFVAAFSLPCFVHGQNNPLTQVNPNSTATFEVVITEIMADPDPTYGLPLAEFVEIYNRSSTIINLSGWTFFDGSNRLLPSRDLLPGEYLILCANSDTTQFHPFGNVAGLSSLSLTNSGEKLTIKNSQGVVVDSVIYSDTWYGTSYKKDGGWTLERIDPHFTCLIAGNWKPSKNPIGGTPGTINSVNGIYADDISPVLLRAFCPDSSSVMLVFSEDLDPGFVSDVQNYHVTGAPEVLSANIGDLSNSRVLLQLAGELISGKTGMVTTNNISDCAGNKVTDNNFAKFGIADSSLPDDVIFNELLFNPFEGGYDFVELYNRGNTIKDLSNLRIAKVNLTSNEIELVELISEEPWLIFPGDYQVLTENPEVVAAHYYSPFPTNFIAVIELPSLNIDEGHLALLHNGIITDEIRYHEDFHFPLLENVKGVSLEKINPIRKTMDPTAWHSASPAAGFATPGFKNSQYAESSSQSKIIEVYPEIFSPDNDGIDDVITFALKPGSTGNIANIRIYNSAGHVIFENTENTLVGTNDAFSWDGITQSGPVAQPGIYVALIEFFNLNGETSYFKVPFVVAVKL